jgi:hypothetical protein
MEQYMLVVEGKTGKYDMLLGADATDTWLIPYESRAEVDESIKHLRMMPDIVDLHLYRMTELKIEE